MSINKKNIARLQEWVVNPTDDLSKYAAVMRSLTMSDLHFLLTSPDKTIAKIAWIEFGRRRGFGNITVSLAQVGEAIELKYESDAIPMAHTVTLDG